MNFLRKLFGRDTEPEAEVRSFSSKEKKRTGDEVVVFDFMDASYRLKSFTVGFNTELDYKGRPGGIVKGGVLELSFTAPPKQEVNTWMSNTYLLRDGRIRFLAGDGKVMNGAGYIISFKDACCIGYKKEINPEGEGSLTTLTILPGRLMMGNEEWENTGNPHGNPYYIRNKQ